AGSLDTPGFSLPTACKKTAPRLAMARGPIVATSGTHRSTPLGNSKAGGITPTTVKPWPVSVTVCPMICGSASNCSRQRRSLNTATFAAFIWSSSSFKTRPSAGGVPFPCHHQALLMRERQGPQQDSVDDAEDGGVRADAERQCDDHYSREARPRHHHAKAEAQVAQRRLDQRQAAPVAVRLLHALNPIEAPPRRPPRLIRTHPPAPV